MSAAPVFVKTGWADVTETMWGFYIPLEGSTADDSEPVIFETREEAEAERAQYIDDLLEAYERDADLDPGELAAHLEAQRESLENEEHVLFVGMDKTGNVFQLDPVTFAVLGPIMRADD
jgi:hypothetical protein